MAFNSLLKDIIEKTVKEYNQVASIDPEKFATSETQDDEILDSVISAQQDERKELWARYYELKNESKETGLDKVFEAEADEDTQLILGLMKQQDMLQEEIQRQNEQMSVISHTNLVEARLLFEDDLQKSLIQLNLALKNMKKESKELSVKIKREKQHLKESKEIQQKITSEMSSYQSTSIIRERIRKLELAFKKDTNSLIEFLNEHFPPYNVPDDQLGLNHLNSMLMMVEDLMNQSIMKPDDPYVTMNAGTYWAPHLQTLVKAGVAEYHPQDPKRLRLVDFTH